MSLTKGFVEAIVEMSKPNWAVYKQWNVITAADWFKKGMHPYEYDPPCADPKDAQELLAKATKTYRIGVTTALTYKKKLDEWVSQGDFTTDEEFEDDEGMDEEEPVITKVECSPPLVKTAGEDVTIKVRPEASSKYPPIDPQKRFYWFIITLFPHRIELDRFRDWVRINKNVAKVVVSAEDKGDDSFLDQDAKQPMPHYHILVKMKTGFHCTPKAFSKQLGTFAGQLYVKPLQKKEGMSLEESKDSYMQYIKQKGVEWEIIKGEGMKLGDDIVSDIKGGMKYPELVVKYAENLQLLRELWKNCSDKDRPQCSLVYIHGPTDVGKTTTVLSVLRACKTRFDGPAFWMKADFGKWWSGYNCQEIIIIDDIDVFNETTVTTLKLLISQGCFSPEIKYGHVDIIAKLLIIITNKTPDEYVAALGVTADQVPPLMRRLTKGMGLFECKSKYDCRVLLPPMMYKCMQQVFGFEATWEEMKDEYESAVEMYVSPYTSTLTLKKE